MTETLDRRLNAYRDDLADRSLEGKIGAPRYVYGEPARICVSVADVQTAPGYQQPIDTQILMGDAITVFEIRDGFAWIQSDRDGYVGYVREDALEKTTRVPTHVVSVPRTFSYSGPDLKNARDDQLSLGALVHIEMEVENRGTTYGQLSTGAFVVMQHVVTVQNYETDFVAVAETLENTPYLWGGTSAFGIDCSGLIQLSMLRCGRFVLRDTDMQAVSIGNEIKKDFASLQRGDLIFWNGHVGVMTDEQNLLHANGNTMTVAREKLSDAVARIGYLYGDPTIVRRP